MTAFRTYASAAAGFLMLMAGAAPTNAQTTVPPSPSAPSTPQQHRRLPGPATPRPGAPNESLGQAPGVIQPPATGDNGVIVPRNQSDTPTPVIRPPGTPGGNRDVQPQ